MPIRPPLPKPLRVRRTLSKAGSMPRGGCVATIGAYDGIHLGHKAILAEVKRLASACNLPAKVISFEPMPSEYFQTENPPARLSRFREKYLFLNELNLDEFVCLRFSSVRALDKEEFVQRILIDGLAVKHLVVGDDFRYGANRAGTIGDLREAGARLGFEVTVIETQTLGDRRISSTAIREALALGDLSFAQRMLGRPYMMSGRVVRGQQLGRHLGFPTANIPVKRRHTAMKGIFAVRVRGLSEGVLGCVANLGNRPTVGGGKTLLEVFIFDFDRDIYGRYLDIDFVCRLRDELKFPDLETMIEQMNKDVAAARRALADDLE